MPAHDHIDDLRAKELAQDLVKGKENLIVHCEQCRGKVSSHLTGIANNSTEAVRDMATLQRYQMEMLAFFYRDALDSVTNRQNISDFKSGLIEKLSHLPILNDRNRLAESA